MVRRIHTLILQCFSKGHVNAARALPQWHCPFYRATLSVSAVFAVVRCPSVRLSVTFMHSIQAAEDIVKLLCRPGSTITLVFWPQCRYPIPTGTPSAGMQNIVNTVSWRLCRPTS